MSPATVNKLKVWLGIVISILSAIIGTRAVGVDGLNLSTDLMPLGGAGGALAASLWSIWSGAQGLLKTVPPPVVSVDDASRSLAGKLDLGKHALVQAVADGNVVARDAALRWIEATAKGPQPTHTVTKTEA